MYDKNLTEDLRLRLSKQDMDFLRSLSSERCVTVSEVIRSIIGEYRRSIDVMSAMQQLLKLSKDVKAKEESCPDGDTKPDKHD